MAKSYEKVGTNVLKETEIIPTEKLFKVAGLKQELQMLTSQRDSIQLRIDEVNALILKAAELGVAEKE